MVERKFGRVVFVSSVSAERGGGFFGGVAYSAAKAAQLGFARALAREADLRASCSEVSGHLCRCASACRHAFVTSHSSSGPVDGPGPVRQMR
jgi:NADP-dependent 3-hydroxy acid dehydrogenase YdfG